MSKLKNFLDRRAAGIAKEKAQKEGKEISEEEKQVDPNLSDDEFWAISNQFMKDSKNTNLSPVEVLQSILEEYTPLKIRQFAKRYDELNK